MSSITKLDQLHIRVTTSPPPLTSLELLNKNISFEMLSLAAKTIMEGGSVGNFTKDQIEQISVENNIAFDITYDKTYGLMFNIVTPMPQLSPKKLNIIFQVQ